MTTPTDRKETVDIKEKEIPTKEEARAVLARTVQDEDRSVIIVEREDILQETAKTRPRASCLVATIAANPGTQRRSADRNNETSSSQRAKAKEK